MSSDSHSADKDYELWWLMDQMKTATYRARTKELAQYGITFEQCGVLFVTQALGPRATPIEISRWLLREHHTVSGLLSRMEKRGLITKVKDLDRKNRVRVTMTEKGRQAYNGSTKRESIHRIMSSLSGEEHQQLRRCMEILLDSALKEYGVSRRPPFPPPRT